MSDEEAYTINVKGLEQLAKALRREPPKCRVGILNGSTAREAKPGEKKTLNNAEIGALYEFNDGNNPNRPGGSFLRVPISDKLGKALEYSDALNEQTMAAVIASGTVIPWLQKVAVIAESIVAGAFASTGYGKWKMSNMAHKTNAQTLVESTQLRESITSEVRE